MHLESCDSYKYLVIIDKKLTWQSHVEYISNKLSKACGALAKLRNCVKIDVLKNVYHALFHSYLQYGILIWGNAAPTVLSPLKTLTNRAIRIMTYAPFGNIDLDPVYQQLKLLEFPKVCKLESAKFEFKRRNGLLPTKIGTYFQDSSTQEVTHTHNLRSRNSTAPPRFLSQSFTGEKSIQYKGAQVWNSLPSEIQLSESFSIFKKSCKNYLIENLLESHDSL